MTAKRRQRTILFLAALMAVIFCGEAWGAFVRPITKANYDSSTCGVSSTTLDYPNQFQICYFLDSNSGFSSGDQVAVFTSGGTQIANWSSISANTTFTITYTSTMAPGTNYVIKYKRGGSEYTSDAVNLETTAPSIADNQAGDTTWRSTSGTTYDIDFSDNKSLKNMYYKITRPDTTTTAYQTIASNNGTTSYTTNWAVDWSLLQEGTNNVSVKVEDVAGNYAEFANVFYVKKDVSAPTHTVTASSFSTYNTTTSQTFTWSASDAQSGISCFYAQYKDVTTSGSWTNIFSPTCGTAGGGPIYTATANSLTDGHQYYFRVQAQDVVGLTDTADADGTFVTRIDTTAPTHSFGTLQTYYTGSTTFNIPINCSDVNPTTGVASGIKEVNIQKWDTYTNPTETWTTEKTGQSCSTSVNYSFTGTEGHSYKFRVQAVDNAGNTDSYDTGSSEVTIDTQAPNNSYVSSFASGYTGNTTFTVSWTGGTDPTPGTGLKCYNIQVRKDSGTWTNWQTCNTGTSATFDTSNPPGGLTAGKGQWDFRSQAEDTAGNQEAWNASADATIIMDNTAPTFTTSPRDGTGADISFTGSNTQLEANWAATDTDSGYDTMDHYEYAIGTTAGGTDVVAYTNNGMSTSVTKTGLTLTHNTTYYFSIKACNKSSLCTTQNSNGQKIDTVAPTVTMTEPNATYVGSASFNVAWQGTDGTAQSGLSSYTVQYKKNSGSWTTWQSGVVTTSATYNLGAIDGDTIYFRAVGTDAVGNTGAYPASPDYHVKTTVNTSSPTPPGNISDAAETGNDLDFTAVNSQISGHWDAVDGAASYLYAVGTTSGGTDLITWTEQTNTFFTKTGVTLSNGSSYYVSVKSKNFAGALGSSQSSDGVKIDMSAPTCSVDALSAYQTSSTFFVTCTCDDGVGNSGTASYDLQYKDGAGAWTDWKIGQLSGSHSFTGANGHTYYYQCRGTDDVGNQGSYAGGTGDTSTIVDSELLAAPATVSDGASGDSTYQSDTASLSANWSAVSGATTYELCFGTTQIACDPTLMDWTDVGNVTTYTKSGLTLTQAQTYYAIVKTKNVSGNTGSSNYSDGVTVDTQLPGTPVVTDEGDNTNVNTQLKASWTTTAGVSGISEFQYAIGTTSGGTDVVSWTTAGTSETLTATIALSDAQTYYVSVKAKSGAGVWGTAGNSDGIVVDVTSPVCTVQSLSATQGTTSFTINWSATDVGGTGIANLYTVQVRDGAAGNWLNWKSVTPLTTATYTGIDLHTFYFQCKAIDVAGNWSTYPGGDGDTDTTIYSTAPGTPVVNDGIGADEDTSTSGTTLSANWAAVSGATEYFYCVGTSSGSCDVVSWTSNSSNTTITNSGLTLTDGVTYYISVKGKNAGGVEGTAGTSDGILVDTSAPANPTVSVPDSSTNQTTYLRATWSTSDAHSGITEYQVSVGSSAGATDVKAWYTVTTGGVETVISGLSLAHGSTYYVNAKAVNGAGLWSGTGSSIGVTVNTDLLSGPATVNDGTSTDEDYSSSGTTISANWTAVSGASSYDYAIGTSAGLRNVLDWTNTGTSTSVTNSTLTLTHGTTYYVSVRARNSANAPGVASVTDGILVDLNAPGTPVISYSNGSWSTRNDQISVSWTATAGISGIIEYQYALGTTSGGTDVVNWTSNGTNTSANITATLAEGSTYYVAVKAKNGAAVWSADGTYGGITVDITNPTCAVTALSAYQSANSFTVNWTGSDAGSGLADLYDVQVKINSGSWGDWISGTSLTTATYNGSNGNTYYFQCRAKDVATNWTSYPGGSGDTSTTVESVAPSAPTVSDGTGADEDFTSSGTTLSANWTTVTGAAEYFYAVGTTSGGTDVLTWTSNGTSTSVTNSALTLTDGQTYYISVKSRNNADIYSPEASSDGIMSDTSAPSTPVVSVPDIYTSYDNQLQATNWSSTDAHSGVAEYEVSVGTAAGLDDVKAWYSEGTDTSALITGLSLTNGSTYYINVRAINQAGLTSSVGTSSGVTVDTTLLPGPTSLYDGAGADVDYTSSTTTLSANWQTVSGAGSYEYAVGTIPGAKDIADWTNVGSALNMTNSSLSLTNHQTYYVAVRARNTAGAPGTSSVTDGIRVETDQPTVSGVAHDGVYANDNTQLTVSWSAALCSGCRSGFAGYQFAVGATSGGNDAIDWTDIPSGNITSSGGVNTATVTAATSDAGVYYISVKAQTVAGVWSDPVSSSSFTVDITAPTCAVQTIDDFRALLFTVSWSGADATSGVAGYDLQYKQGAGGTWTDLALSSDMDTSLVITKTTEDKYYFQCRATDVAGNIADYPGGDGDTYAELDKTSPTVTVTALDTYQGATTAGSFQVSWTADDGDGAGVKNYDVQYKDGSSGAWIDWVTDTASTSGTFTGQDGHTYYFQVRSEDNVSNLGDYPSGSGHTSTLVDLTNPQSSVTLLAAYTNLTTFTVGWSGSDGSLGSGVATYDIQYNDEDIDTGAQSGWQDLVTGTSDTSTTFNAQDRHKYYFRARSKDRAGNQEEYPSGSDTFTTVDSTLLGAPEYVYDGSAEDVDYTDNIESIDAVTLSANWAELPTAKEYQYSVVAGSDSGYVDVIGWTTVSENSVEISNSALSASGKLSNGTTYYVKVRGVNFTGVPGSEGLSDGIMVDVTKPVVTAVADAGEEVDFAGPLTASWAASDGESGIAKYEYTVTNKSDDGDDTVQAWTDNGTGISVSLDDLVLVAGTTYYVSVRATNNAGIVSDAVTSDGILAITKASVTIPEVDGKPAGQKDEDGNIIPDIITKVPEDGANYEATKEFKFVTMNGSVTYDQLIRTYYNEDGDKIYEEPIEAINLATPVGEARINVDLKVPGWIISNEVTGKNYAIIALCHKYVGTDNFSNRDNFAERRLYIKFSEAHAVDNFVLNSVEIENPSDGGTLSSLETNIAKAKIGLTGSGPMSGVWMLDGEFFKGFRKDVVDETEIISEQPLPNDLLGDHTLQLVVTLPEYKGTDEVSFTVQEDKPKGGVKEFHAGALLIKDVSSDYDKYTDSYTGSGNLVIPMTDSTVKVSFKRLKIEEKDGKHQLVKGVISTELQASFENGPLTIELTKLFVSPDKAAADGKVTFAGTDELPEIGPFYFYAANITEEGIKSLIRLSAPQKGTVGKFQIDISDIYFSLEKGSASLKAGGRITTAPKKVLDMYLHFGYSPDGSVFTFSPESTDDWGSMVSN